MCVLKQAHTRICAHNVALNLAHPIKKVETFCILSNCAINLTKADNSFAGADALVPFHGARDKSCAPELDFGV